MSGKSFQLGKNQQKAFNEMKREINKAPIIALPNLQKSFEVENMQVGMPWEKF
jgi:hypothetical protein